MEDADADEDKGKDENGDTDDDEDKDEKRTDGEDARTVEEAEAAPVPLGPLRDTAT